MKNTRICPKCNGSNIIRIEGKAGPYGMGNNIQVGWSNLSAVLVHRYLCCDCNNYSGYKSPMQYIHVPRFC